MKKNIQFTVTPRIEAEFESAKKAMGHSILLNWFDVTKRSLVITDASGDGFGHILLQRKESNVWEARDQAPNRTTGEMTNDTGLVVIHMGSAALKPAWRNYSALELEATCLVWSLETLAYYLKGCPQFDLWTKHSTLAQSMKTEVFDTKNAIQAYNFCIYFVRGCHN